MPGSVKKTPMSASRVTSVVVLVLVAVGAPTSRADRPLGPDGRRGAGGYVVEQWSSDDGLPVDAVSDVQIDHDGYVWIATFDGLVRFDGVRFTVFDTSNTPQMGSNRVIDLWREPPEMGGAVWLRTELNHLLRYDGSDFVRLTPPQPEGQPAEVRGLVFDRAPTGTGSVWVLTTDGLYRYREGVLHRAVRGRATASRRHRVAS